MTVIIDIIAGWFPKSADSETEISMQEIYLLLLGSIPVGKWKKKSSIVRGKFLEGPEL